jgi:excisionase family DNA binding protein
MDGEKQFYRPDEVAERFRVSRSYVYWLIRKGKLKAVRIGRLIRIPKDECCKIAK